MKHRTSKCAQIEMTDYLLDMPMIEMTQSHSCHIKPIEIRLRNWYREHHKDRSGIIHSGIRPSSPSKPSKSKMLSVVEIKTFRGHTIWVQLPCWICLRKFSKMTILLEMVDGNYGNLTRKSLFNECVKWWFPVDVSINRPNLLVSNHRLKPKLEPFCAPFALIYHESSTGSLWPSRDPSQGNSQWRPSPPYKAQIFMGLASGPTLWDAGVIWSSNLLGAWC